MSLPTALDILLAVMQLGVLVAASGLPLRTHNLLPVAFFGFAIACGLLSTLYWVTFDFLRPETRMPFAANQISELALFLLLAACLRATIPITGYRNGTVVIATVLFAVANVALWIGWSGEWVQDILGGVAFGYLLCVVVLCLRCSEALTPQGQAALGIASLVLVVAQASIFFVPGPVKRPLDLFCYALLFAVGACFILRTLRSLCTGASPAASLSLAFASYTWMTVALYMSSDAFYLAALVLVTLCLPLMLFALRGAVTSS